MQSSAANKNSARNFNKQTSPSEFRWRRFLSRKPLQCNGLRDVLCEHCQTCRPGFNANNSVSQATVPCPDNGKSARGSDVIADCTCIPGFYRSGDLCVICPIDSYCPRSFLQPVACPVQGLTFYEVSHCPHFMRAVTGRLPSCSKMPMSVRPTRLPLPARVLPRPAGRRGEL